jgi:hypothetical protein
MPKRIVFVAIYDKDCITVSGELPEPRFLPEHAHFPGPVTRGYGLVRLRIESATDLRVPEGDLTEEQYREWRSGLMAESIKEEGVNGTLVALGLGSLCVEVKLEGVDAIPYGTLLEATVTNVGPYPIGKVQVAWHGEWEPTRGDPLIGKGLHLRSVGEPPKELLPGKLRKFVLIKPDLQKGLSYAASLPPGNYYLGVHASLPGHEATYEIHRVPGAEMGAVIEMLEQLLETEGEEV